MTSRFAHRNLFEHLTDVEDVEDVSVDGTSQDGASQDDASCRGATHNQHEGAHVEAERWDVDDGYADILQQELDNMPQKEIQDEGELSGEDNPSYHTAASNQLQADDSGLSKAQKLRIKGGEQMIYMSQWFGSVMDRSFPIEKLPIIVVEDTERAPGYANGEREEVLTELGLSIIPLARVRELFTDGHSFLDAWAMAMRVVHLRIVENGRWQLCTAFDRHGDRLWQAAFAEFGESYWVHLKDLPMHIVRSVLPRVEVTPDDLEKIILVAHAMSNDEGFMKKLGFQWTDHFEVLEEIDTQVLTLEFIGINQPGLLKLLRSLGIKSIRKHHGGNDALYTAFVLCAVVLHNAKQQEMFEVQGDPTADVGAVVDQYRHPNYVISSCEYIENADVCNTCGCTGHDMLACNRRCLYCGKRRLNMVYHNYHRCPDREKDEEVSTNAHKSKVDDPTKIKIKLQHTEKCLVLPARDSRFQVLETVVSEKKINARTITKVELIGEFHNISQGTVYKGKDNAASTIARGVTIISVDPRLPAPQMAGAEGEAGFACTDYVWPVLGS